QTHHYTLALDPSLQGRTGSLQLRVVNAESDVPLFHELVDLGYLETIAIPELLSQVFLLDNVYIGNLPAENTVEAFEARTSVSAHRGTVPPPDHIANRAEMPSPWKPSNPQSQRLDLVATAGAFPPPASLAPQQAREHLIAANLV